MKVDVGMSNSSCLLNTHLYIFPLNALVTYHQTKLDYYTPGADQEFCEKGFEIVPCKFPGGPGKKRA